MMSSYKVNRDGFDRQDRIQQWLDTGYQSVNDSFAHRRPAPLWSSDPYSRREPSPIPNPFLCQKGGGPVVVNGRPSPRDDTAPLPAQLCVEPDNEGPGQANSHCAIRSRGRGHFTSYDNQPRMRGRSGSSSVRSTALVTESSSDYDYYYFDEERHCWVLRRPRQTTQRQQEQQQQHGGRQQSQRQPQERYHHIPPWFFLHLDGLIRTLTSVRAGTREFVTDDDILAAIPALKEVAAMTLECVYDCLAKYI